MFSADIRQNFFLLTRVDKSALAVQLLLLGIGVLFIRVAGMDYGSVVTSRWKTQLVWITAGFVLYFVCALADYRKMGRLSFLGFLLGLVLLGMVFVSGGTEFGARSVLRLGGVGVQVSEPMKAATMLFVAWVLSHPLLRYSTIPPALVWLLIIILPFMLIILHGDGGTALVYIPFSFSILFINGLKWRWIAAFACAALLAIPAAYPMLKNYQKQRVLVFLKNPGEQLLEVTKPVLTTESHEKLQKKMDDFINGTATGENENAREKHKRAWDDWNARQVLYATGAGRLTGRGYGKGLQHTLGFLPRTVAPTDFIYGVICEEAGFAGAAAVLLLFAALIVTACRTAARSNEPFGAGIAAGAAVLYATHVFINIGMCIGLAPIIGIPLPFVSYGGSSIMAVMIVGGLVQSVHIHTLAPKENEAEAAP